MAENHLWFGYLEAGEKSSPVVMDNRLSTGQSDTIYVYNHRRGAILEYKREIAESKLRELKADEKGLTGELNTAYRKVRNGFTPRGAKISNIPEKGRPAPAKSAAKDFELEEDYDDDVAVIEDDDE